MLNPSMQNTVSECENFTTKLNSTTAELMSQILKHFETNHNLTHTQCNCCRKIQLNHSIKECISLAPESTAENKVYRCTIMGCGQKFQLSVLQNPSQNRGSSNPECSMREIGQNSQEPVMQNPGALESVANSAKNQQPQGVVYWYDQMLEEMPVGNVQVMSVDAANLRGIQFINVPTTSPTTDAQPRSPGVVLASTIFNSRHN